MPWAKPLNATVIWRAFDDQFQSGFRIIMEHEAEKIDGITLEMQDGENDVSKTTNKLEAALTKGADAIAVCAPDRLCTAELMKKADAENVPVVFFNMESMAETMEKKDSNETIRSIEKIEFDIGSIQIGEEIDFFI